MARRSVTASADPMKKIPASASGRLDQIHGALASLREEERRLHRLGFRVPLERCREQRRYWEFLAALFSLGPPGQRSRVSRREFEWRTGQNR